MSSRISNSIPIKIITKTQARETIPILVPVQRRERTKSTSLSMPPSVKRKVADHAKLRHMSFSEFVTLLCTNYLDAVEITNQAEPPRL